MQDGKNYGIVTEFIHLLISMSYSDAGEKLISVDATAGNGFDTLFLTTIENNYVYSFDIQDVAIANTEKLLRESNACGYKLIEDGHENVDKYVTENIDIAIFNLGYLPNGDKQLHTAHETTIEALTKIIDLLSERGRIYIAAYLGHDDAVEANAVCEYISKLDRKKFNVLQTKLINKKNSPPQVYIIEKK